MKRYVQLGLRIRANSEAWSLDRIWGPGGIDEPQAKDEGFARYASVDATWDPCSQTILVPVGVCDAPYRVKLMKAADAAVQLRIKQLQDIRAQLQKAIDRLGGDDNATEPPEDAVTPATWMAPTSVYYMTTTATADGGPAVQIVKVQRARVAPDYECGEAYAIGSCESLKELPKGRAVQLYLAGVQWDDRPLDEDALQSLRQAARECVTSCMEDCAERSALLCTISSLTLENASRSDVVPVHMPNTSAQEPGRVARVVYQMEIVCMPADGTASIRVSRRSAEGYDAELALGKAVELHTHGLLAPWSLMGGNIYLAKVAWYDSPLPALALASLKRAAVSVVDAETSGGDSDALKSAIARLTLSDVWNETQVAVQLPRGVVSPLCVPVPMPNPPSQEPGRRASVVYRLGIVGRPSEEYVGIKVSRKPTSYVSDPPAIGKVVELQLHGRLSSSSLNLMCGDINLAEVAWDNSPLSEQALASLKRAACSVADAVASGGVCDALKSAIARLTLNDVWNETPVVVQLPQDALPMVECTEYRFTARQFMGGGVPCVRLEDNGRGMASSDRVGVVTLGTMSDLEACLHDQQVLASVCIPADDELEGDLLERLSDAAARKLVAAGYTDGPCPEDLVRKAVNAFKGCDDDDDSEDDACEDDDSEDDEDDSEVYDDDSEEDELVDCVEYRIMAKGVDGDISVYLDRLDHGFSLPENELYGVESYVLDGLPLNEGAVECLASVMVPEDEDPRDGDWLDDLIVEAAGLLRNHGCEGVYGHDPRDLVECAVNEWLDRNCERPRVVDVALPPKRVVDVALPPKRVVDVTLPPKRVVDVALPPKSAGNSVQQPGRYIQW